MPGSSNRPGATRRPGSKKGALVGSGGQRRKGLEGKGPTPKAADRPNHKAHKTTKATTRGDASSGSRSARGPTPARRGNPTPARRGKASSEIVAGRNSVLEALRTEVPAATLFVASRIDSDDRVREVIKLAGSRGIPMLETPRTELDRITDGAVHQGLALQVPAYTYRHPGDLVDPERPGVPVIVALDGITDPRNLGAIIRSVAAFGGHGVLVPARRSVGMTAAAWKSSAGAAARIPVAQATNLTRALLDYRQQGFFVVGLDMDADVPLPGLALAAEPLVIVVGSEGKGLSRLVRQTCDQIAAIPMSGPVESLNAGMALAVAMYEVARARDK